MLESELSLANFTVASPTLRPASFDHDDFIFELTMDGFRALARVGPDENRLASSKGTSPNPFLAYVQPFTPAWAARSQMVRRHPRSNDPGTVQHS
jgi:hypothetical protein